jgi:hypothetical protein
MRIRVWYGSEYTVQLGVDVFVSSCESNYQLIYQGHVQEFNKSWFGREISLSDAPHPLLLEIIRELQWIVGAHTSGIKSLIRELDGLYDMTC